MKTSLSAILVTALGTYTALADYTLIGTKCGPFGDCNSWNVWIDAFGYYGSFNANGGCRPFPGPPGMQSICWDWTNKRGHFFYANQPKRCIRRTFAYVVGDESDGDALEQWDEVPCTW